MKKIATNTFIYSSVAFGIIGIIMVLNLPMNDSGQQASAFHIILVKLLFISAFIILPSFALSVASKYLSDKS